MIHHLGIISNLLIDNAGVIQLLLCFLEGYCLSYLVQFSIVLLEAIRNFYFLCYNIRKVIASSTQTQNMLIPSLYLVLCSIVNSVDACAVPMCRSRCPDRLVKACRCLVCSLILFIKLWAKNCLIALVEYVQQRYKSSPSTNDMLVANINSVLVLVSSPLLTFGKILKLIS